MKTNGFILAAVLLSLVSSWQGQACTGITLRSKDSSIVIARTVEWGSSILNSDYVIIPRGHHFTTITATGPGEMTFNARYGFVGISVVQPEFIVDGMNEAGLAAGLFFFPQYGQYEQPRPEWAASTLPDMQFVSWILASFSSVDEVTAAIEDIHITALSPMIGTVHWRVADASGRQIVIEVIEGKVHIYDNPLGVLTNAPSFDWHLTNLNNYINLHSGTTEKWDLANGVTLRSFGSGSAMLGLPGDVTPPSRFVRAAFFVSTAPTYPTAQETVVQSFHILNNFDIPVGVEYETVKEDMPMSATQWTTAASLTDHKFYYRTYINMNIRCIDLSAINFKNVSYQSHPLETVTSQPIENIRIK